MTIGELKPGTVFQFLDGGRPCTAIDPSDPRLAPVPGDHRVFLNHDGTIGEVDASNGVIPLSVPAG